MKVRKALEAIILAMKTKNGTDLSYVQHSFIDVGYEVNVSNNTTYIDMPWPPGYCPTRVWSNHWRHTPTALQKLIVVAINIADWFWLKIVCKPPCRSVRCCSCSRVVLLVGKVGGVYNFVSLFFRTFVHDFLEFTFLNVEYIRSTLFVSDYNTST